MRKPYFMGWTHRSHGSFYACAALLTALTFLLSLPCPVLAADGAREALELRYQAELAIAEERAHGNRELAVAMEEQLSGLLQEYLVTRDGSIALDTVDAAFVQEQFKVARAMEEPGVALALDVFSGPGTGYENDLRTSIIHLADFNARMAGRVSEAALDAHERAIERQLEQLDQHLIEKLEATVDRVEFEQRAESSREAGIETRLETKVTTTVEKLENRIEAVVEQAEKLVEVNPEKTEQIIERAESKIEQIVQKAEEKIESTVQSAQKKLDSLADSATTTETPSDSKGGPKK